MAIIAATATERLRLYRSRHRIEVDRSSEWDRCDTDGVRVHMNLNRTWRHDPDELIRLQREAAVEEENARVAAVIREASAPLREFVVESGPGWIVTADADDLPIHNHRSPFDAPREEGVCARCDYDIERAEG